MDNANIERIKATFWLGLKAFVPLVVTLSIVIWIFKSLEAFFGEMVRHIIPASFYFKGLGIIVGLVVIFTLGILLNAWFIRKLYALMDDLVKRIPLIKTIYNAVNDLFNYFDKSQGSSQQTVLIESPIGKMIGFITRTSMKEVIAGSGQDDVLVYVPLSYMVGGVSLVVPRQQLTFIDWPVDKAMSFILTAGMTGSKKDSTRSV